MDHLVYARGELGWPRALLWQPCEQVEQSIHTRIAQGRPKEHRKDLALPHQTAKGLIKKNALLKIFIEGRLVGCRRCLMELGRREVREIRASVREPHVQLGKQRVSIRPIKVHLVHKEHRWHAVTLKKAPERGGMTGHAVVGTDHQHGNIQHRQRALGLGGEVNVTGGIHQCKRHTVPRERRLRREDRDAARAFLLVGVEVGVAMVHAAGRADDAGMQKHRLGERGLARVDVRQYAHNRLFHESPPIWDKGVRHQCPTLLQILLSRLSL